MSVESISKRTGINPKLLQGIREEAYKDQIQTIYLFGSRARGDYEKKSDIDLAISGGDLKAFRIYMEELAPSLLQFDIIDLSADLQESFRERIYEEGIKIYEKI